MRTTKPNRRMLNLLGLALALLMITSSSAFAQGSIFGTVQNSNATTPANGEIGFYGFLDNTDEEVRIETSIGAGFDNGNWFDDFQNYLTEAPGNPYSYYFFNTTNGEGAILSKTIPNNSFQQENITLGAIAWPAAPTGLTGTAVSGSTVILTWDVTPGLTWHVYRRAAGASGSFFRLDNPAGSLANPGTADSFFVDNSVDGASAYDYMLIAEDGSGNLSPHSVVTNVNSAATVAPVLTSIDPNNGSSNGNTLVNIYGSNFDPNGMSATINGAPLTSVTVVSPYHLTGLTPAGTTGSFDVAVTNSAAALPSNVLAGAFTYNSNAAPVLAAIGAQTSDENANLNFNISANDVDGNTPVLTANGVPTGASFTDNLNGSGTFDWTPTFADSGTYAVTFIATDAIDPLVADSEVVTITINNVNRLPVLTAIGAQSTSEGVALAFGTSASDADGDTPIMTANNLPTGASYTDNLNGTASFSWTPGAADSGSYIVTFVATDGAFATDSTFEAVTITVGNVNQLPVLAAIGPQATDENANLNFNINASDGDGEFPLLSTSTLPTGASFNDNLDGTGTFDWTPTFADSGVYSVTFYATDASFGSDVDSETVAITVNNVNQLPVLAAIGAQGVTENVNLNFNMSASDADGNTPLFSSTALPSGATLTDNLDGTATFDWTPSFVQSGAYPVTFYATDAVFGTDVDSEQVVITITEAGNQLPVLTAVGPQGVTEGGSLNFNVSATDAEGVLPLLSADSVPANATFTDNLDGTGTFDFNPDFTQEGIYNVYFIATDDSAAADTQIVVVTVAAQNQAPVLAAIGAQSTTENLNLNFGVSASDGDGDTPVLSTSTLPGTATFIDNLDGSGTFDWTPTFADSGTYNVTFYATDAVISADVDSEVVVITVNDAGNQVPVWTVVSPQVIFEGDSLGLLLDAADADGTIPVLSADSLPANATFTDNLDGTALFTFKPSFVQAGSYLPLFIASDGVNADTMRIDITVTEGGNVSPIFVPIADTSINEGGALVLDVSASDPEGGNISLTMVTTLSNAFFTDNGDGTGQMTYNPTYYDADIDTVRFIATDNGTPQLSSTEIVVVTTIDINQAPVFDSIGPFSVLSGSTLQFTATAFDSTDADSTHRIFMTATGVPTNATYVDNGDNTGTFTFNPVVGQEGPYTITLIATDEGVPQRAASLPINITVVGVNQPPELATIGAQDVLEGEVLIVNVSATDPDGGAPQLLAEKGPENSSFVDNGDGTGVFTFSPSFLQAGLHSVTIKAFDGISVDKEVVLIQVYEAGNQVPIFTNLPSPSVTEGDSTFGFITGSDPDGGTISFAIDSSGILMENFVLVDSGNGAAGFAIHPDYTQAGPWDISIIISDGEVADTSIMTVTVVEAGNQDPILNNIPAQTITEGQLLQFTAIATDVDGTIPVLSAAALPGSATFQPFPDGTGLFSWTPTATDNGVYSVRIYAQDADFAGSFDSTDVTISVIDSNFAPIIRPDPVVQPTTVFEGEVLTYRVITTDADGTIGLLGARLSSGVIGDPLVPNMTFVDSGNGAGALTFAPDATQGAVNPTKYNIVFYVKDGGDTTMVRQTGTITYNCYPQNIPPSLFLQLGTGPLSVTEGEALNFVALASDVDGTAVVTAENLPANAVIVGNGDQIQLSFTPDYTQAGQYSVLFIATDDLGAADSGTVVIDVIEAGNQNPQFTTALPTTFNVAVGITSEISVISTDPEGEALTLSYEPAVPNAGFIDFGDGTGSFTIIADSTQLGASYPISFICVDANLAADTISTTLQVNTLLRGDADANRMYSMNDIVYLINYLYRDGPLPTPEAAADVDNSGSINVSDVAYLISYMYQSGPRPPQ